VALRASSSGAVIDWYAASSGGTALKSGSNTYTTPSLSASKAYYAQGRNSTTSCLSASRTSVTATVTQPGASGAAPTSCGCASGLTACNGKCAATCPPAADINCTTTHGWSLSNVSPSFKCDAYCLEQATSAGMRTYYSLLRPYANGTAADCMCYGCK
jgi:hypothetical protein